MISYYKRVPMKQSIITTPRFKLSRGLSLIEVLVTIVITSIGLMGLVSLQMQAVRATNDSGNRSQALWVWTDMANRIRANKNSSASYIDPNPVNCAIIPAVVCGSYHNGTVVRNPPDRCTGQQLAEWDRYEVACPLRPSPFFGDSNKYLPDSQLTITCADNNTPCEDGDRLIIDLEWRARMTNESITGAARTEQSGLLRIVRELKP